MIIAMAIAVVITTGVMVPIITDSLDNAGGGNTDSEKAYENKGDVYLSTPDGVEHTILIEVGASNVTLKYDGTVFQTLKISKEYWSIPLWLEEYDGDITIVALECITYVGYSDPTVYDTTSIGISNLTYRGNGEAYYSTSGVVSDLMDGDVVTITTNYKGNANQIFVDYIDDRDMTNGDDVIMYLAPKGDYVLTATPVVDPTKDIIAYGTSDKEQLQTASAPYIVCRQEIIGYATIGEYNANQETFYNSIDVYGEYYENGIEYIWDDAIYQMTTEEVSSGIKIKSMNVSVLYLEDGGSGERTESASMKFIVPVSVEKSKETPANGFWALANNSTSTTISLETTANGIAVYDVDWYDDDSATPFLTVNDLSTFVPIMIGETFSVIIDSTSRAGNEGYYANMYIFGDSAGSFWGFAKTSVVSIEGTQITFTDWTAMEGQQVTLDGLIAYISPDGTYTSVTDTFEIDFSKPVWTAFFQRGGQAMVIGGSVNSPTILNDTGPLDITVAYTTDSDRVSGIEFSIDGGNTPIEHQTTMSIQPISQTRNDVQTVSFEYPFYESDGYEPSKFMFSVIPIEEEESGGSGGSLSPALVAMVTAIPIVVIAGLVLVGVGVMRGGGA